MKASSWKEAAAAAGVTLVEAGEETEKEDIVQRRRRAWKKCELDQSNIRKAVSSKQSLKKMFKEAFDTDKTRLEKRHAKYDKPVNFLILVADNVHYLQVIKPL